MPRPGWPVNGGGRWTYDGACDLQGLGLYSFPLQPNAPAAYTLTALLPLP